MQKLAVPHSGLTRAVLPVTRPSETDDEVVQSNAVPPKVGIKFFLIFASMCVCLSLSALELSSVSTALPTIAGDLHAFKYTWVGSAYALTSTAFLPMTGGFAQAFGRRPAILIALGVFALGSCICGAANSMNMLIAGRALQGFGGGATQSLTGIILADLVTLRERGIYVGLYAVTWCVSMSIGPFLGGSLAMQDQWRWIFYLNLILSFVALLSVVFLLDLPVPPGGYREKITRMDWIGNFLVISTIVACSVGLTWGGITVPWSSARVLVPLVLGIVGLGVFIVYEATLAKHPIVPFSLMTNITSISGYLQTICSFVIASAIIYYFPLYFMVCKGASSMVSGIYSLGVVSLAPAAIITGYSVKATGLYRPQIWIGWICTIIALGLMNTILATDSLGKSIGYLALLGWGAGMLNGTSLFPIQAPLPVTLNAHTLTFMWFLRSFAFTLGIAIGSAVLQNQLVEKLPASFIQSMPQGTSIIFALVSELSTLPQGTRSEVVVAYADSLASLWRVLAIICGTGLVSSLFMKGLPLHNKLDADWAPKDVKVVKLCQDAETAQRTTNVSVRAARAQVEEDLDISAGGLGLGYSPRSISTVPTN